MTSAERHEARYKRRKAKRDKRKNRFQKSYDEVYSFTNLYNAGIKCCANTRWKTSTMQFELNLLEEAGKVYESLQNREHVFKGFKPFTTFEHGKLRQINALDISDRMHQKCMCNNFLVDVYSRNFYYDNSACLPNKGMLFTLSRFKKHLHDYFKENGRNGYIYQYDFKSYFSSLPHFILKENALDIIKDKNLQDRINNYIDDFKNLYEFDDTDPIPRGIGLGSEISQILGSQFATEIDLIISKYKHVFAYGRYNDDGLVICKTKKDAKKVANEIHTLAESLGIKVNKKKDLITPLDRTISFLKVRFNLTETGRVLTRVSHTFISKKRRKLRNLNSRLRKNKMTFRDVTDAYQGIQAYVKRYTNANYRTLLNLDGYFKELFKDYIDDNFNLKLVV